MPDVRIASSPSIVCVRCCTDSLFLRLCSAYYYADAYPQHNGVPGAMNPDGGLLAGAGLGPRTSAEPPASPVQVRP